MGRQVSRVSVVTLLRGLAVFAVGAALLTGVTTAEAQVAPGPSVTVAKTVYAGHDAGASCAGSELVQGAHGAAVTYCFEVTNTGDTTLAPVTLADADLGITEADMTVLSGDLASMAAGDVATLYVESTISADLTNTVSVAGTAVGGGGPGLVGPAPVTAEDTAAVEEVAPSVSVAKTVYLGHDAGAGCAGSELATGVNGDAVTYCFVVTNDGETTLSPVTVADADLGLTKADMTVLSGDLASMAPGDTATLYVESLIDGDLTNTATVTGAPVDAGGDPLPGGQPVTAEDTAAVDEVGPSVSVDKTVYLGHDAGAGCAGSDLVAGLNGDAVTYCFVVTNDGDTTLAPVTVVDADLAIAASDMTPIVGGAATGDLASLAPGESAALYVESTIDGDLTNTATVAGVPVDDAGLPLVGIDPVTAQDTAQVDEAVASISVEKTVEDPETGDFVESAVLEPGADATFQIVVSNTGDVPLSSAFVDDPLATSCDHVFTDTVAPGESFAPYTCVVSGVDAGFVNTAGATGTPVDDLDHPIGEAVTDEDVAVVEVVAPPVTDLAITKDLVSLDQANRTATWGVTVTNQGDTAATEPILVADDLPPELGFLNASGEDWSCEFVDPTVSCVTDVDLAPGESSSLTIETSVLSGPDQTVTNVAGLDGVDDNNVDNNSDEARVDVSAEGDLAPDVPTDLPRTGADIAGLLATAGLLILTGTAFRRAARRRMAG